MSNPYLGETEMQLADGGAVALTLDLAGYLALEETCGITMAQAAVLTSEGMSAKNLRMVEPILWAARLLREPDLTLEAATAQHAGLTIGYKAERACRVVLVSFLGPTTAGTAPQTAPPATTPPSAGAGRRSSTGRRNSASTSAPAGG